MRRVLINIIEVQFKKRGKLERARWWTNCAASTLIKPLNDVFAVSSLLFFLLLWKMQQDVECGNKALTETRKKTIVKEKQSIHICTHVVWLCALCG